MSIKTAQTLVSEAMKEVKTISPDEAFKLLEENNCNLIDIREQYELEMTGTLENSINIPRSHLEFQFEPLTQNAIIDTNKETVLFCAAVFPVSFCLRRPTLLLARAGAFAGATGALSADLFIPEGATGGSFLD